MAVFSLSAIVKIDILFPMGGIHHYQSTDLKMYSQTLLIRFKYYTFSICIYIDFLDLTS